MPTAAPPPAGAPLEVLIVGAGPAGLAVGACLLRRGISPVLLESGEAVGWSWRNHYRALSLHTTRGASALPFRPYPPGTPKYPSRGQVADYLEDYARSFGLDIRLGEEVTAARPEGGLWSVQTRETTFRARHLVLAPGANASPRQPPLPGRELYRGTLLHSRDYRDGAPFRGRRVLVVGFGNTGADLARDLLEHGARPAISEKAALFAVPLEILGINWRRVFSLLPGLAESLGRRLDPRGRAAAMAVSARFWAGVSERAYGDLRSRGLRLQSAPEIAAHWAARLPPLTAGAALELVRHGGIEVFPGVERLDEEGAVFTDGRRERFDAILLATGFRPSLGGLCAEIPGALLPSGEPPGEGRHPAHPTLYFCGFLPEFQHIASSAREIARHLAEENRPA